MTREDAINLGEDLFDLAGDFNEWLENMSEKYGLHKDDIQAIIKQLFF